jgi:hypothetical protein
MVPAICIAIATTIVAVAVAKCRGSGRKAVAIGAVAMATHPEFSLLNPQNPTRNDQKRPHANARLRVPNQKSKIPERVSLNEIAPGDNPGLS